MAFAASSTKGSAVAIEHAPSVERNGQQPVCLQKWKLQSIGKYRLRWNIVTSDQGKPAIGCIGDTEIALGNQPQLYQDKVEPFGCCFRRPTCPGNRPAIDKILSGKQIGKSLCEPSVPRSWDLASRGMRCNGAQQLLDVRMTCALAAILLLSARKLREFC